MEALAVPPRYGGNQPVKAHRAECRTCGDFGTINRGNARTVAEILRDEIPCTCKAGDLWREVAEEWAKPVVPKSGGKAAA